MMCGGLCYYLLSVWLCCGKLFLDFLLPSVGTAFCFSRKGGRGLYEMSLCDEIIVHCSDVVT